MLTAHEHTRACEDKRHQQRDDFELTAQKHSSVKRCLESYRKDKAILSRDSEPLGSNPQRYMQHFKLLCITKDLYKVNEQSSRIKH